MRFIVAKTRKREDDKQAAHFSTLTGLESDIVDDVCKEGDAFLSLLWDRLQKPPLWISCKISVNVLPGALHLIFHLYIKLGVKQQKLSISLMFLVYTI